MRPAKIQLSDSGVVLPKIIDIATKGYLNVAEAKRIQKVFNQDGFAGGNEPNLFLIAAAKIKALSTNYCPPCNYCGDLCDTKVWYRKKMHEGLFARDEDTLRQLGENGSLHDTLKQLCGSYVLCKSCFDQGLFPKVLQVNDFE